MYSLLFFLSVIQCFSKISFLIINKFLKRFFVVEGCYMSNLKTGIEYLGCGEDGHAWIELGDMFSLLYLHLKILEGL